MFEVFAEPIHAIMAFETGIAICQGMGQGKSRVYLTVAGLAGVGCEGGDVAVVAIIAGERFIRSCKLVTV